MGLFDKLKRGKSNLTMDAIICEEYEQQYFDECKYIWKIMFRKLDKQIICRENY